MLKVHESARPKTYPPKRRCGRCGVILSIYNPNDFCAACRPYPLEPVSEAEQRRSFRDLLAQL